METDAERQPEQLGLAESTRHPLASPIVVTKQLREPGHTTFHLCGPLYTWTSWKAAGAARQSTSKAQITFITGGKSFFSHFHTRNRGILCCAVFVDWEAGKSLCCVWLIKSQSQKELVELFDRWLAMNQPMPRWLRRPVPSLLVSAIVWPQDHGPQGRDCPLYWALMKHLKLCAYFWAHQ